MNTEQEQKIREYFVKKTNQKFLDYCRKNNLSPTTENLLSFLCSHTYVERKNVIRSFILDFCFDSTTVSRTSRIDELEANFDLSRSHCWTVLKHHTKRFVERKRVPVSLEK